MPGVERFTGIIEAKTVGEAELQRFSTALEKVAGNLDKSGQTASKQGEQWNRLAQQLRTAIEHPLQAAGMAAEGLMRTLGPVGISVVAFGASAGLAAKGVHDLAISMGNWAEEQLHGAYRTGLTTKEFIQFAGAAKLAGMEGGIFELAVRKLSEVLTGTGAAGKEGRDALHSLGVTIYDATGRVRPMGQLWLEMADAIAKIQDPMTRVRIAQELWGRSGREIVALMPELRENVARLRDLGFGIDEKKLEELHGVGKELELIDMQMARLARKAKIDIIIAIKPIVEWLAGAQMGGTYVGRAGTRGQTPPGQPADIVEMERLIRERLTAMLPAVPTWATEQQRGFAPDLTGKSRLTGYLAGLGRTDIKERLATAKRDFDQARAQLTTLAEGAKELDRSVVESRIAEVEKLRRAYEGLKAQVQAAEVAEQTHKKALELVNRELKAGLTGWQKANEELRQALAMQGLMVADRQRLIEMMVPRIMDEALGLRGGFDVKFTGAYQQFGPEAVLRRQMLQWQTGQYPGRREGGAAALGEWMERLNQVRERGDKAALEHQLRMLQLLAGPGGEVAAIERAYQLRIQGARSELDLQEAIFEREEAFADLQKQRLERYREAAGQVFDALTEKGAAGIRDFLSGQLRTIERTIFQNLAVELYKILGKTVGQKIPGQYDKQGQPTLLGRVLAGTPFGADPLQAAGVTLSTAGVQLQVAAQQLIAASTAVTTSGGGGGTMAGLDRIISGSTANLDVPGAPGTAPSTGMGGWLNRHAGTLMKIGAAAGAGFGVYQGIRMGGGRGAATAIGSALGGASLIPGPQQPFLVAGSLISAFMTSVFGDPKAARAEAIDKMLQKAAYTQPTGRNYTADLWSRGLDYNYRGELRPIIVNVNTLDARSFMDRRREIASATRLAMQEAHELNDEIRDLVNPY